MRNEVLLGCGPVVVGGQVEHERVGLRAAGLLLEVGRAACIVGGARLDAHALGQVDVRSGEREGGVVVVPSYAVVVLEQVRLFSQVHGV